MNHKNEIRERFEKLGESYAAGLFEDIDASMFLRFSRALRRYFENYKLPIYNGEPIYPCGVIAQNLLVKPDYSFTFCCYREELEKKDKIAADALQEILNKSNQYLPLEHTVGGNMYTHSYPNFKRIIKEGLVSYEKRIKNMKNYELREGLLEVISGIRILHANIIQYLQQVAPDSKLLNAYKNVPFKPAKTLYEAIICLNFIYYLDGCDDIGRLDADLIEYYNGEDVTDILRCFFRNVDANNGWSGALGPDYNPITLQCIKAIKGIRRPSIELRVTPDMPQEIWDASIESIYAGGGSPSFYNEIGYQNSLVNFFPEIPKEDLLNFAGGGCTETMLAGMSNVGSCDAGINVALIFSEIMRSVLPNVNSFEAFYKAFIKEYHNVVDHIVECICLSQKERAEFRPHPMRTLLVDDCIEREKDFNNGGAKYHWSVINIAGMINVIDSFLVIKQIVFTDNLMSGAEFINAIDNGEKFLNKKIERYGTDSAEANAMAQRLSNDLSSAFNGKTTYLGGKFLPASIQFVTYIDAGKIVPATPDGRSNGAPLCDSIAAIHGNDKNGITAMLNSAASLCQKNFLGTPVLNIKLDKKQISKSLKALTNGYFKKGGLQIQITCVNEEELLAAKENPEKYPNLIVRIGGYSEYFNRLSPELQQTVIDRTIYGI